MIPALRPVLVPLLVSLALAPVGCGSTAPGGTTALASDGGIENDGAATKDAETDAPISADGSACIPAPAVGSACIAGQVACPIHVDACCGGVVPVCQGSPATWVSFGVGCACTSRPCGDRSCGGNQICKAVSAGVPAGNPAFSCEEMPKACATEWTCDCVKANLGATCTASACVDKGNHVDLTCMGQ